jgi:hypothetical protein
LAFLSVVGSYVECFTVTPTMRHNGLQLPEGGDYEALHCQPSTNFDRSTKLDLTTEPPLLGRCCYKLPFCLSEAVSAQVCTELLHCLGALACTLFCFFWVGLCGCKKANVSANGWAFGTLSIVLALMSFDLCFGF